MNFEIDDAQPPLTGPGGRWAAAATEGGVLGGLASFTNKDGRVLPLDIHFSRPPVHVHVANELAEFEFRADALRCTVMSGLGEVYCGRVLSMLPFVLPAFAASDEGATLAASLGDEGYAGRVLSFSSIVPDFLVPDPYFMSSDGYRAQGAAFGQAPGWDERIDRAYWRGTDTGTFRYRNPADAPRIEICRISLDRPDIVDARITAIEPHADAAEKQARYEMLGYLGPYDAQDEIVRYRYQVDIDGNTNTWSSFFLKLLTGSPVLKVDSECGFHQWYYAQLIPYLHYVPVKPDLSNFTTQMAWLRANTDQAKRIGAAGRAFALDLGMATEVNKATATVERLIALNRRVAF